MQVEITSDLSVEPVSVAEARAYLRITTTAEDSIISGLITSARMRLEKYANLSFGAKTIQCYFNELYGWQELPYQPNSTITSIKDNDADDLVYEERGVPYKSIKVSGSNGVIVIYEVEGLVNEAIKEAIKKEVATAYDYRQNFSEGQTYQMSNDAKMLVQPFSRNTFLGI